MNSFELADLLLRKRDDRFHARFARSSAFKRLLRGPLSHLSHISHKILAHRFALKVNPVFFSFDRLPPGLNGFRILQIGDPHFLEDEKLAARLITAVRGIKADLMVLTGDYVLQHGNNRQSRFAARHLGRIAATQTSPHKPLAVLGNHDPATMAGYLSSNGIDCLIDQTVQLDHNGCRIIVTGTDDPYSLWSGASEEALARAPKGDFRLALMHSPNKAHVAANAGFDLCLSGHTHGGGVRLGKNNFVPKKFNIPPERVAGKWAIGTMQGYTTTGVGTSSLPLRINVPAEVALITLRQGPSL